MSAHIDGRVCGRTARTATSPARGPARARRGGARGTPARAPGAPAPPRSTPPRCTAAVDTARVTGEGQATPGYGSYSRR